MVSGRAGIKLALRTLGTYNGVMGAVRDATAKGATMAAREMEREGKHALRADVREGFPDGERLARTWRSRTYPGGAQYSLEPAVLFWSKAPVLKAAFEEPATIVNTSGGKYVAIPTEHAPRRKRRGRKLMSALDTAKASKSINLQFVPIDKGKTGLLVDRQRKGNKTVRVVMFVLVRQATLRKRINYKRIFRDFERQWPDAMARGVVSAVNAAGF
ncbi:MAG: DUF6441 family protein [Henriciella sp.]|nr:DUF6441 family protein [Henriciella sp.]